MKNKYNFIILFLLSNIAIAQPIVNSSDIPSNFSVRFYDGDISGLTVDNSGPDQMWDFSTMPLADYLGTIRAISITNAPSWATTVYPTSNYCQISNLRPELATSQFYSPNYEYYKLNSSSMELVGRSTALTPGARFNINPKKILSFPFHYNDIINDSYSLQDVSGIYTFSITYDAYGTLIMPFGTYNNVIRTKKIEDGITSYTWSATTPYYYNIMTTNYNNYNVVRVYENLSLLNINNDIAENQIRIYPNPASTYIFLENIFNINIEKVFIIDVLGKIIIEQNKNTSQINIENLTNGIYILKAYSDSSIFQTKFIKE